MMFERTLEDICMSLRGKNFHVAVIFVMNYLCMSMYK